MEPKPGDLVEVKTENELITGTVVPSPEQEESLLLLKLKSGYNIGLQKNKVKEIKILQHYEEKKVETKKEDHQKGLPTISILHTGGTIASKVDYRTGGVVTRYTPEEILEMFPEVRKIANIHSRLISNMWSEDMRFAHYNIIMHEIAKEAEKGVDGIIVTHGTDTLHYSSAALAFGLEGLGIPVILVGSQRSSDRGSTDSALNLISAAYFIANSEYSGVAICMHETLSDSTCLILPATKTRKMHTSRRDAFRPINASPIARVEHEARRIDFLSDYNKRNKESKIEVKSFDEQLKIGMLKAHPNMHHEEIKAYENFDGLVIEGFALGHASINQVDAHTTEHKKNLEEIRRLSNKIPVAMASQCIYGRLQMNVYSTGRDIQAAGAVGNLSDMTPETTFIKLAWLLSNHKKEAKELLTKSLRGEITERTEKETFLA